ncbi:hypothetical protein SVAN01_08584 [Stagonosporopsis vannaccii]|nr:hypothetical protein SVAN01_08584 [Stagonosporopsis vannaccii]
MSTVNSPRLPGVPILHPHVTGAEYSRWRRGIKFACETKGTWGFCDGTYPMPMPRSPRSSNTLQPSLLDERKAWVRQEREVRLDIFLSLSEDVMEEVLYAGPPLPPSNMSAQQMVEALDRHFTSFKFNDYHHVFCHFLNLHMDSYGSLEEFNIEFKTTLEDLRDYGHPLSNVQACSAYFSKLRCTQNPWVAKKLEAWETEAVIPKLENLMKESMPWTFKPSRSSSPNLKAESIPEELIDDTSSQSDTENSSISTTSSPSKVHSRQTSNTTAITTHSLEITVHASSEDIAQIDRLPRLPASKYVPDGVPCNLSQNKGMPLMGPLPPMHRPLPPLPKHMVHALPRARSASPRIMVPSPSANISSPKSSAKSTIQPQTPSLRLETTHPTLRPRSPTLLDQKEYGPKPAPSPITPSETKLHPALRQTAAPTPSAFATTAVATLRVTPPLPSAPFEPDTVAIPWPSTPDRPTSSRADLPPKLPEVDALTRLRAMSGGSTISLPLSGPRSISPPRLQDRPLLKSTVTTPPLGSASPSKILHSRMTAESVASPSRTPTFESLGVPRCGSPDKLDGAKIERSRSPVRELVARLSGEGNANGNGSEGKEEKRRERKKSWSLGVGLGRFGPGKGVKEIV